MVCDSCVLLLQCRWPAVVGGLKISPDVPAFGAFSLSFPGVQLFPRPDLQAGLIEDARIILFADLFQGFRAQQFPQRIVLVVNLEIPFFTAGRHLVCTKKEAVRIID